MGLTKKQVIDSLSAIEPDYVAIAKNLGAESLPLLVRIVKTGDSSLAARATSVACKLNLDGSKEILLLAARNQHVEARIAAAYGLRYMSPDLAKDTLALTLNDADDGVRKVALRSIIAKPKIAGRFRAQFFNEMSKKELIPNNRKLLKKVQNIIH